MIRKILTIAALALILIFLAYGTSLAWNFTEALASKGTSE